MRLGSACPSNPRFSTARKGGPPALAREHDVADHRTDIGGYPVIGPGWQGAKARAKVL